VVPVARDAVVGLDVVEERDEGAGPAEVVPAELVVGDAGFEGWGAVVGLAEGAVATAPTDGRAARPPTAIGLVWNRASNARVPAVTATTGTARRTSRPPQ
jgi:hypothetical protein